METVIIISSDHMGSGDEELGTRLMRSYLHTLSTVEPYPDAIVFYNGAVRLLGADSGCVDALATLHEAGVDLLACVTCLEHFSLLDCMAVGTVSNMREIVTTMQTAKKVITV